MTSIINTKTYKETNLKTMKDNLQEKGYTITITPYKTPYNDLNLTESVMLGFLLESFTDRKTFKCKKAVRWSKSTLQTKLHLGRRQLDTILKSLQEKDYLDINPIANLGTIFTLNDKGLEVYNEIYAPN